MIPNLNLFNAVPSHDALSPMQGAASANYDAMLGTLFGSRGEVFMGDAIDFLQEIDVLK